MNRFQLKKFGNSYGNGAPSRGGGGGKSSRLDYRNEGVRHTATKQKGAIVLRLPPQLIGAICALVGSAEFCGLTLERRIIGQPVRLYYA